MYKFPGFSFFNIKFRNFAFTVSCRESPPLNVIPSRPVKSFTETFRSAVAVRVATKQEQVEYIDEKKDKRPLYIKVKKE